MTATPETPEARADKLADEMAVRLVNDGWVAVVYGGIRMGWSALIAQAIRDHEDAAYETAAALAETEANALDRVAPFYRPPFAMPDEQVAMLHEQGAVVARNLSTAIRALKSQEPA